MTKHTNKLQSQELISIFDNNDFILLTEVWSNELCDISFDGFTVFQLNRTDKKNSAKRDSGGIAFYIKNHLTKYCKLLKMESDDIIWVKIDRSLFGFEFDLYMCLCYIIPSGSSREALTEISVLDRISDFIVQIANDTNNCYNIAICGDLNSRVGTEQDFVIYDNRKNDLLPDDYVPDDFLLRNSQDKIINANGRKLLDFCKQNGLRICNGRLGADKNVGKFTFIGSMGRSLVDYVVTTPNLFKSIVKFKICDPNILSDHCVVEFSICQNKDSYTIQHEETDTYECLNKKYSWDDAKRDQYIFNLNSAENDFSELTSFLRHAREPDDINHNISNFTNLMENVCDPLFAKTVNVPKEGENTYSFNHNTQHRPWFDEECEILRTRFYTELNKYRENKTILNEINMVSARKSFKKEIRRKRFNYDKSKTEKLITLKHENAKAYWRLLKQAANQNVTHNISSKQFADYFKAINDPDDRFFQVDEDIIHFNDRYIRGEFQIMFDELNGEISRTELLAAIKQLRNGASSGPDLWLNEFFKNGTESLMNYLHTLFNKLFLLGYFPESWSEGFIVPVFKKGDVNDVSNYRGITLLSTLGKLFTRILNNRLNKWAEEYSIYTEAQAGFRKHMSTIDNIFVLNGLITHCINNNENLYCCFVDFTKAFDYVERDILWFKLIKIGVRGHMLDIIKSIYNAVKSRVKNKNTLSEAFTCNIGVRQGECLSPFLFAMYVNDLEQELAENGLNGIDVGMVKLLLLLYADDIVLFSKTPDELQKALNILEEYCNRWKLTVNTTKTKIIIFRKGGRLPTNLHFTYNGTNIDIVNKFCYLGIVFTSGGSSFEAQKTISGQALKAIFTLNKYLHSFTTLKFSHILDLFDKLISPILNYGSEVWGFHKAKSVEIVHMQFCKKMLGVKQSTQNDFVYGELGRIDYQSQRYINIVKFWLKLVYSNNNKYIKCIYNMMLHDLEVNPNKQNWASMVKNMLGRLGFLEVWNAQGVGNKNSFIQQFKLRVRDNYVQDWHARLENSTRARFYVNISDFKLQKYLEILNLAKYRKSLCRLRVSSHRLAIEAGRWTRPNRIPLDDRKCLECNKLEDEFHFIIECSRYTELRSMYIKRYYWRRPNMPKFIQLMTSENNTVIKNLSVFIEKAFKIRTQSENM